jgi:TfoX/Sxy family transcriptional regulator of competence genes
MSPGMPAAEPRTFALFQSLVPAEPGVEIKPMFGQRAAFVHGNMFFGTFGGDLLLRLDEGARAELLAAGGVPFSPMAGRVMKEYVVVPGDWQREPSRLRPWVKRSLAWVATLPAKAKKAKRAAGATKSARAAKPARATRRGRAAKPASRQARPRR